MAGLLAALAFFAAARADDIPSYQVLGCEKDCPPVKSATALSVPDPVFPGPMTDQEGNFIEAMVDVDFTVATDGSVKDVEVENLLGDRKFADAAIYAVGRRRYAPAMEGDKPVEENHRARFIFGEPHKGARRQIINEYGSAVRAATGGDVAGALKQLGVIAARTGLNLYERTMVALAQSQCYARIGDYAAARDAIRVATINEGAYLARDGVEPALRERIRLEAASGDFAESFAWFEILRAKGYVAADDSDEKLVAALHDKVAGTGALITPGAIPPSGTVAMWQHVLLRRSFEFHGVSGKLDHFLMHCDRHSILSPVSDTADWTVPASWSGCYINVRGAPGARFQFVELPPAKP